MRTRGGEGVPGRLYSPRADREEQRKRAEQVPSVARSAADGAAVHASRRGPRRSDWDRPCADGKLRSRVSGLTSCSTREGNRGCRTSPGDGTLIEAWASHKAQTEAAKTDDDGSPRPATQNDTHQSTTDPEAKLYRRRTGARPALYLGHALMENRNGLPSAAWSTSGRHG